MAIYHFSAKVIGRSGGRSAIASAAYRAAERLHDVKLDRAHDYTAKAGIVHSEILLPEGAPERWCPSDDSRAALRDVRERLWNEVEAGEKRKDAQLARDIEISLPRELGRAEAIRLARDFVREQFVDRGMVADLNVHWTKAADGELQPHAHVMLTMRRLEPVQKLAGEKGHDGKGDRERHPGRGAGGAPGVAENPGVDGGAEQRRSDRPDPGVAAIDPQQPAHDADPAGGHRAASRGPREKLGRVIAAVRLRVGLQRQAAQPIAEIGFGKKETAWNDRALLGQWRERWASLVNERLVELGHEVRIDHRSNVEQGLALEPQHKTGPAGMRREQRDEASERAEEHREIARRNGETIIEDPGVVLDAVTRQHATFTRRDLARFVSRHTVDRAQFDMAMAKAEAAPELVRLGTDGRGEARFTTQAMLMAEQRMERAGAAMARRDGHLVSRVAGLQVMRAAEQGGLTLGEEQKVAVQHVTSGPDLALVVGYAGTGKSAMLGVARAAWEAEGYTVRGAALSGIAAEGLEAGSGIASRTLASLEWAWKDGRDLLSRRDVLVVDEAGLVGSRQMERVLSAAQAAGAKVVLVGDPEQLQSIEAGAAFRALSERHGAVEISAVRRQRVDWQRDATRELATERTAQALERYVAAGMVQAAETRDGAKAALVAGWDAVRREGPDTSQIILAYRRDDVRDLNGLARERLRASGELGADQVVQTAEGARAFAAGDRLMFRQNKRGLGAAPGGSGGVAVKNGTLGTVLAVEVGGERLTVRLDGAGASGRAGREVTFSVRDYAHVDHGYASTIHKAQGVTVDRAHVLASGHMDRHAAYVALTRHRDGVALHYGRDEFRDGQALARTLGREGLKDSSLDYDGSELTRRHAERRGFEPLHPASEIVVPALTAAWRPERAASPVRDGKLEQAVAAGRAGFRQGFAAHQQQKAQARDDAAARELVQGWEQRLRGYNAALPGLEADPTLGGAREPLLRFARELREQPGAVRALRERGEVFGMAERPNLARVLGDAQPEQVVAGIMAVAEDGMRADLKQVAEQEAAQQRELRAQQRPSQSRGMSMG